MRKLYPVTRKEYFDASKDYRGKIKKTPYFVTMNLQTGGAEYVPVKFVNKKNLKDLRKLYLADTEKRRKKEW